MTKKVVLITGAAGEIGQALIRELAEAGESQIITLDLAEMPAELSSTTTHIQGSITDTALIERLGGEYQLDCIYHLAALLSTRAEHDPALAHHVNVDASVLLLELAAAQSAKRGGRCSSSSPAPRPSMACQTWPPKRLTRG